ncbi:beta-ketoacyl-[acyl-carrier-protein] synthase family protein [Taibaiella lutea]|uniref:Beta-ketoacyl-[acyl-carrier-protein] synthase family protein n=1 Tax=Taibaiella lutea TaxID=2608001 RepID=A0A5M6CP04_9BACT|nr:beta-ketoacyl-[acyl-carrier-protein] synthase family protein [Taibaiella lutea]KAA5536827.1 beta-ketoacyl-[acyl-carrier-protein] synthase family protein [Taibaiella lutea]
MARIFVTGMGVISAIGNSVAENLVSLREGKCGIGTSSFLDSKYASTLPFGEVKWSSEALKSELDIHTKGITRTSLLALHACNEAIKDAEWSREELSSSDTALIGGTTVGGMCLTDELYHDSKAGENGSEYLTSYDCASVNIFLQQHYKMNGIANTINTACSSAANAIMYGARLMQHGFAKRAIVGGFDSLAKFTVNGFNALHILSDKLCKPFDQKRKGLNLGEGAAFLILEKEEDLNGKKVYAELTGFANSNDAFHPSSLSDEGDGPYIAMKKALGIAGLQSKDISFINVHGTGTENNDLCESKAILRLFENIPPFTSTKSNIGHTLGAAGAIEAVYSILNIEQQEVFPHLNFENGITETNLIPLQNRQQMNVRHVMSNSFGFGGNCSSLIFSKY